MISQNLLFTQYFEFAMYSKHHVIVKEEINKEMKAAPNVSQTDPKASTKLLQFHSEKPFASVTNPSGAQFGLFSFLFLTARRTH